MQAVWWILLGISALNYAALIGFVLPKIFFKAGSELSFSYDRGLKNYKEKNGRSIVYQPQADYRKYVSQYILSQRNGKKGLLCKLNRNISRIDFDLYLFGGDNKVFQILNIKQDVVRNGYSGFIELPPATAYATLIVNSANDFCVNTERKSKRSLKKPALFTAVTGIIGIVEIFFAKYCLAMLFGDVLVEAFTTSALSIFITFGVGLAAVALNTAIAAFYIKQTNKKDGIIKR